MKFSLPRSIRSEILREKAYALRPFPEAIKLNQNELPYDLPPKLKRDLLRRLARVPLQRYPLCQPVELQKRLAKKLGVKPNQVQVSNGSNVMIQALILMAAVKGRVMVVEPTFTVYEIQARMLGNRVIKVPLEGEEFRFPLRQILRRIQADKPDIVFLPNPNAPTGNLFSTRELLEVVRRAPGLVVVDEAYFQFSKATLLPYLKKFPNLIILRTFSKGFGLGGVRVGYAVASPELSEQIAKILLPYCLSALSEQTALFVLDHEAHFKKIIAEVVRERKRMLKAMQQIKSIRSFDSDANFILFRCDDAQQCFLHLLKNGVLVRDVSNKFHLMNCLRVSVGRPVENDAFLRALMSYHPH
jgi:histidinol-phosphate aminotransferase